MANPLGSMLNSFVGQANGMLPPDPMDAALAYQSQQAKPGILEQLAQLSDQMMLHGGGRSRKLNGDGSLQTQDQPRGLDWLAANGPNRPEVQQRYNALANDRRQVYQDAGSAVQARKMLQDSRQNFFPQDSAGTRLALGPDGQPVGFSTPGPSPLHQVGAQMNHLPQASGQMLSPTQASIQNAAQGFQWPSEPKDSSPAAQNVSMDGSQGSGAPVTPPAPSDARELGHRPNILQSFPSSDYETPSGLVPWVQSMAGVVGGDVADIWNKLMYGTQPNLGQAARKSSTAKARSQPGYKPKPKTAPQSVASPAELSGFYGSPF